MLLIYRNTLVRTDKMKPPSFTQTLLYIYSGPLTVCNKLISPSNNGLDKIQPCLGRCWQFGKHGPRSSSQPGQTRGHGLCGHIGRASAPSMPPTPSHPRTCGLVKQLNARRPGQHHLQLPLYPGVTNAVACWVAFCDGGSGHPPDLYIKVGITTEN